MEVEGLPFIPLEIVVGILSRLPVKTLLQFKSVCKRWYYLISDSQFVKMHLKQVAKQGERILLSSSPYKLANPLYSIDCEASCDHHQIQNIDFPSNDPAYKGDVYGSCNGLLLIGYRDCKLFLWNPFTREFREIPYPYITMNFYERRLYGLGYDSTTDDYKLVVVIFIDELDCSFLVYVFSLKSNRWKKKIEICPYEVAYSQTKAAAVLVNGALHWVMIDSIDGDCYKVVCFDLAEEKLRDMSLPGSLDTSDEVELCLGVLGGSLCVVGVMRTSVRRAVKVWVMTEYGLKESWTNLINFTYNESLAYIAPFCFTNSGDIVVELEGKNILMVVNGERKVFGAILVDKVHEMPFTHVETLVSVHGSHGSWKRCLKRKIR